ncbi:MAG TPA: protein kinase [Candidatus Angelobacter sp.]|jgi:serine/threonine protein kinase
MVRNRKIKQTEIPQLVGHANVLGEIGLKTKLASIALNTAAGDAEILVQRMKEVFKALADELDKSGSEWNDEEAAKVIDALRQRLTRGNEHIDTEELELLDLATVSQWLRIHHNDAHSFIECLVTEPPSEITIIQLLSRAGSQKVVFLANWHIAQREVVLKRFIAGGAADRVRRRELLSHPLSMEHPNIIETHFLRNSRDEIFLVERRLPEVLSDGWTAPGVEEAANLLRDIASALAFLQQKRLIHGDVKPDNIGFEDGRYILLDFGICRSEEEFLESATPTGSLRTRAPELLFGDNKHSHECDLWALGATVFNSLIHRFPLFKNGDVPPRVWEPEERSRFEKLLADRVEHEYDSFVRLSELPDPLRPVLSKMLARNPSERGTAKGIVELCQAELAAFLRISEGPSSFSPAEELDQMSKYLPGAEILRLMSSRQKHDLKEGLSKLRQHKGLTAEQHQEVMDLEARLS